nr:MAG TPA: hypothetical protein [Caudoviricetes sp.]
MVIRIPGRTVGNIKIDDKSIIKNISIDIVLAGRSNWYIENVNDKLKKFIGMKVIFPME